MRILVSGLLVALAAVPVAAAAPAVPGASAESRTCLRNRDIRAKRLTAGEGYFAQTRAGWWRNTGPVCPAFAKDRALVTRGYEDRQCSGDLVEAVDPFSRISYGACVLGNWERVAEAPPVSGRPQGR